MNTETTTDGGIVVSIISRTGELIRLPSLTSRKIEGLDLEKASREENFGYVLATAIAMTLPVRTYPGTGVRNTLEIVLEHDLSRRIRRLVCQIRDSMDNGFTLNYALIESRFFSDDENELIKKADTDDTLLQVLFRIAQQTIRKEN